MCLASKHARTDWREIQRFRALKLKRDGWTHDEVAEALSVSKTAVSKWMKIADQQGDQGRSASPRKGAKPRLTTKQLQQPPALLEAGAEKYGFRREVWICERVASVIRWEFNVTYHKAHVSRLLKALAWTPQRPLERATQRDEAAIIRWRNEVWPDLKKKARRERRLIICVDEVGFYLLPGLVGTYAPCGETPILKVFQTRDHLSVMSGITTNGQLATLTRSRSLSGQPSVLFLRHLLSYFGCWLSGMAE